MMAGARAWRRGHCLIRDGGRRAHTGLRLQLRPSAVPAPAERRQREDRGHDASTHQRDRRHDVSEHGTPPLTWRYMIVTPMLGYWGVRSCLVGSVDQYDQCC